MINAPSGKTVIIGSSGRMGAMLLERGRALGLDLAGLDLPWPEKGLESLLSEARLAILCVPVHALEELLPKLVPHLPPGCVLSDITSVKEQPMRLMERHWTGSVVGAHPLFGPMPEDGQDLPVALVPGTCASKADIALVSGFYQALGCRVFECSASLHDRAMAKIQNMNFITHLAYFALLAGEEELLPFLTPSFERSRKAAAKSLTEDAAMFAGLFEANPHSHEAVRQYRKMLNVAAAGDLDLLCERARWWFDKDGPGTLATSAAPDKTYVKDPKPGE